MDWWLEMSRTKNWQRMEKIDILPLNNKDRWRMSWPIQYKSDWSLCQHLQLPHPRSLNRHPRIWIVWIFHHQNLSDHSLNILSEEESAGKILILSFLSVIFIVSHNFDHILMFPPVSLLAWCDKNYINVCTCNLTSIGTCLHVSGTACQLCGMRPDTQIKYNRV